MRAEMFK